jgi:ribokinase
VRIKGVRVAVVGHVEWVQFARVEHVPLPGEVAHATDGFEEPAGGGAVAAVQLARLAGGATLFTALGDDETGRRAQERLEELGVEVRAQVMAGAQTRRAVTLVDAGRERTITTFGPRLDPSGAEDLGWERIEGSDAVYFTAGDESSLRLARAGTKTLVASPRSRTALEDASELDALVSSASDEIERDLLHRLGQRPRLLVLTEGARGGSYEQRGGEAGRWAAQPSSAGEGDSYGCGDSFAAGLTYGLGGGMALADALALGARCGAACLGGRGPYESQLTAADI